MAVRAASPRSCLPRGPEDRGPRGPRSYTNRTPSAIKPQPLGAGAPHRPQAGQLADRHCGQVHHHHSENHSDRAGRGGRFGTKLLICTAAAAGPATTKVETMERGASPHYHHPAHTRAQHTYTQCPGDVTGPYFEIIDQRLPVRELARGPSTPAGNLLPRKTPT